MSRSSFTFAVKSGILLCTRISLHLHLLSFVDSAVTWWRISRVWRPRSVRIGPDYGFHDSTIACSAYLSELRLALRLDGENVERVQLHDRHVSSLQSQVPEAHPFVTQPISNIPRGNELMTRKMT